jgi:hypothetical protein
VVLCVLLLSALTVRCRATSESDAQSAIEEASQRIFVCYKAIVNASAEGANVSDLLSVLNYAGSLLSGADLAFASGDFDSSYALARNSTQTLMGFDGRANGIGSAAVGAAYADFMVNVVGSAVGAVVVLVSSFVLWMLLKARETGARRVVG